MDTYLPNGSIAEPSRHQRATERATDRDETRRVDAAGPASAYAVHFDMFGTLHLAGCDLDWPRRRVIAKDSAAAPLTAAARRVGRWFAGAATVAVLATAGLVAPSAQAQTLLNVSYDPTRELYRDFNEAFNTHWEGEGHAALDIQASHGGSGSQARAVIDGLAAQVVTLALGSDIDAIASKSGKIPADWQTKLPHNSAPYTSTIVFLVREGNPKGIVDWGDLIKDDVQVITPNPKTSGGARWNYLAAWAYADKAFGGDEAKIKDYIKTLFEHVPVLDTGARGSTTTFAQRGIGDVLLAWENEAFLALDELGEDQFDIVVPSISILAEPTVAVVQGNITSEEQGKAAQGYLDYLYSPQGQAIALRHFFRAWDTSEADPADVARFPEIELVSIADFGGWAKVQPEHFGDGGIFDQIFVPR